MAQVINARRYLLLKARNAYSINRRGLAYAFNFKRRSLIGTALPSDIPHRAQLIAAWYETVEELEGADDLELMGVGLSPTAATSVVAYVTDYYASL